MKTIELNDDDWARLKRKLMTQSVDDALKDYAARQADARQRVHHL